jgi:hypothetical protein
MLFIRTVLSGGTGDGAGARTADGASSSPVTGGPDAEDGLIETRPCGGINGRR